VSLVPIKLDELRVRQQIDSVYALVAFLFRILKCGNDASTFGEVGVGWNLEAISWFDAFTKI